MTALEKVIKDIEVEILDIKSRMKHEPVFQKRKAEQIIVGLRKAQELINNLMSVEKQNIIDAYNNGCCDGIIANNHISAEQYYKNTFKK